MEAMLWLSGAMSLAVIRMWRTSATGKSLIRRFDIGFGMGFDIDSGSARSRGLPREPRVRLLAIPVLSRRPIPGIRTATEERFV